MIITALEQYLSGRKAIRNLIGTGAIFRGRRPQGFRGSLAITLRVIATRREYELAAEADETITTVELNIWAYAVTPKGSELAEAVRDAISGDRGYWGDVWVEGCTIAREQEIVTRPTDGSDDWPYRYTYDFRITHKQSVPTLREET